MLYLFYFNCTVTNEVDIVYNQIGRRRIMKPPKVDSSVYVLETQPRTYIVDLL